MPTSVISRPNPSEKPVTMIVNVAIPIGMLRRRWIVSFQVRSSNGALSARTSGFGVRTCAGAGGRVIEVSMLAA